MSKLFIYLFLFFSINPVFSKESPTEASNLNQQELISLDKFLFNHGLSMPNIKEFRVKVAFREGDIEEKMWVVPFIPKNGGYEGVLANEPVGIKSLKLDDNVNFTKDQIITWRYDGKPLPAVFTKAEAGDADAQYAVGFYYQFDVRKDSKKKAFKWYLKAAEQGDYRAQNNVSTLYMNGTGVEKNFKLAVIWLAKAAEQGDALAQANLGHIYYVGMDSIKADKTIALKLFQQSVKQQNSIAQYFLGRMYLLAEGGLKRNDKKAKELLMLSAMQYNQNAIEALEAIGVKVNFAFEDPEKKEPK